MSINISLQYLKGHMSFGLCTHTYVLASYFQKLCYTVMTICLLTEVMRQWAMLVLGWVTFSVRDQLWDVSVGMLEFLSVMRLL